MHISFILKKVFDYMYRRKLNFCLTVIISLITVYMLAMALTMIANSFYHIFITKKTINDTDFLNINILNNVYDMDYFEAVEMFDKELSDIYGDDYGKFMYMDVKFTGVDEALNVLYIDKSIMDLCNLNVNEGTAAANEDENVINAFVGYNLKDEYPVGTILENIYTGTKLQIVGVLDKNSTWIPDLLFHTLDAVQDLDNKIVSELDYGFIDLEKAFYANTFNSFYIKCDSDKEAETAKLRAKEAADKYGVMIYCNTVDELIESEKEGNKDFLDALGILFIFVLAIAVLAYSTSNIADIYSRQYDFGVMYINGVSSIDIFMMIWLENLIKLIISFGVSAGIYIRGLELAELYVFYHIVIPVLAVILLVFSFVVSALLTLFIKKKDILSLIGGERL